MAAMNRYYHCQKRTRHRNTSYADIIVAFASSGKCQNGDRQAYTLGLWFSGNNEGSGGHYDTIGCNN
ncbi:MAG: hypothetical protein AAFX01_04390 [Cyanobacteria bacterium J06638_28]